MTTFRARDISEDEKQIELAERVRAKIAGGQGFGGRTYSRAEALEHGIPISDGYEFVTVFGVIC